MARKKTAIVTGASSGIGLGLTTALLEHGYRVVANSRHVTEAGTLAASDDLALVDGDMPIRIRRAELLRRLSSDSARWIC